MAFQFNFAQALSLLDSQLDLSRLIPTLLDIVLELTAAERGMLMLRDENEDFVIQGARNLNKEDLNQDEFNASTSVLRQVIEEKEPVYVSFLPDNPSFAHSPSIRAMNLQSVICLPLWPHHKKEQPQTDLLGLIYIDSSSPMHTLDEEDLRLMQGVANHVAVAIQNAKLFSEIERKNETIARLNLQLEERIEMQAGKLAEIEILLEDTQRELGRKYSLGNLIGKSAAMRKAFRLLEKTVTTDETVLIQGESGTGKELAAKYLHLNGPRSRNPMIPINCAAWNDALLESELFGHRKGAFTGAEQNKIGVFQVADGGTLFLDEVADMSSAMQSKLLRVLQNGEIRPIGSNEASHVDVRVIAACNRPLEDMVARGQFRQDLYFRLNVIRIDLPALRERLEDLPLLIDFHLHKIAEDIQRPLKRLPEGLLLQFMGYSWPGNVRELINELRRFVVLDSHYQFSSSQSIVAHPNQAMDLACMEREAILRALKASNGKRKNAAKMLGIPLRTFYKKLRKYDINH